MVKNKFNPMDWLSEEPEQTKANEKQGEPIENENNITEIDFIIQQIENNQIDITQAYSNWRDIGFAFADAFGEAGRDYFHRISKFYIDYDQRECDNQFNNCLKSNGKGITLKTFFHYAKQAGIKIGWDANNQPPSSDELLPRFPKSLFEELPEFLQKTLNIDITEEEKDIMLLGTIVSLSACIHTIHGIYDAKKVYANLYIFITAQASAGKGRLVHCKQLVQPIHKHWRSKAKELKMEYEMELALFNDNKKGKDKDKKTEKPTKPPEKMLFIPANNSTTGVFQLLFDNEGRGLMFETEGDTLAQAFKTDYGNYSDGFRKAFHHETISYYRRTDREYVDIDKPCLSGVFTGTPKQISNLIPNAENGLFSRFIFYSMNINAEWKNVFINDKDGGLDSYFGQLGDEFYSLYKHLIASPEIRFQLTQAQKEEFNTFFTNIQSTYINLLGLDYMATIRRLGLIAFRIAMVFSALRIMEHGENSTTIVCEERDFKNALMMIEILIQHAGKVFSELPAEPKLHKRKNKKERFLDALPNKFNRQTYLKVASKHGIPNKTAEGYITDFCKKGILHRDGKDNYINPNAKKTEDTEETKD